MGFVLLWYSIDFYYYAIYRVKKNIDYHTIFILRNNLNKQRYWSTIGLGVVLIIGGILSIIMEIIDMIQIILV